MNKTDNNTKKKKNKATKRTASEMNKVYKPGECMKYMNIEVHPTLLSEWYMSDVKRELSAVGSHIVPAKDLCYPELLMWTRTVPRTLDTQDGQVKLSSATETCDQALYIATMDQLSDHIASHTLAPLLKQTSQLTGRLTLVLFGVKDYLKSSRRKTANSNQTTITELELEMAITDLLVSAECDTVIANTPNELALLIVQFTKAIAEAPYKKAKNICDDQAEFYMRGDKKKCVSVDKEGVGVGRLWQQMIAILPHSSLETSRALCAEYKSPLDLFNALQEPDSINKLADIGVSRAAVPGAKARRIGPELARKLHILFTATDGNVLVD